MAKREPGHLYTFDFETDPFKFGRIPRVFAVGVYCITTGIYEYHWGDQVECVGFLLDCMEAAPQGSIFWAHNGGKFDFHFFLSELTGSVKIIGARIAQARCRDVIIRDSFAMLPVPLSKFGGKLDIDYAKMEAENRDKHRAEILEYLEADCRVLGKAIARFVDEFGMALTMAGAAMRELAKRHEYDRILSKHSDATFREFYYGGRVECIESGELTGAFKCYDVNSMYPAVMRNFQHPVSSDFIEYRGPYATAILERCDFAEIEAVNDGCLPCVGDDGRLSFRRERGTFKATGHEIRAGLETGTLAIIRVAKAWKAERHSTFAEFVDHFFAQRAEAKARGDALLDLFYKLVLNSSYGKFAQNPERFKDWKISACENTDDGWVLEHLFPDNRMGIWSKPTGTPEHLMRFNVATAASVTGAARAQLWRGLCAAKRPIYCDTDSMICEDFAGDIDAKRLGAWKFEGEADAVAIAGRKMYALWKDGATIKQASKGVKISAGEIRAVARGGSVRYRNEAPTFSAKRPARFIERDVRRTV